MEQQVSEITNLQSMLDAAHSQIRTLEDQLAQQQRVITALSEDRAFREAVIQRAAEGVCVCHNIPTHPFVRFTVWNQRMKEITGYTMKEINARGWYETMYPDPGVQERARQRMERMREGDDLRYEHWEITNAAGAKRLIAISTSVLIAKDNSVHVLGLMHDCTNEERLKQEAVQARIDDLTGVKNRRCFMEHAEILFHLAARQAQPLIVAYIDVDDLKAVNDMLGHGEGDEVLKALGKTLVNSIRRNDVVGRLGGDEFAVVLLNMKPSFAKGFFSSLHERLLKTMRDRGWVTQVSMGVVCFSGSIPDIGDAIKHADTLMYKAKKEGKGKLCFEV